MTKKTAIVLLTLSLVLIAIPSVIISLNRDSHYEPLLKIMSVGFGFLLSLPVLIWTGWKSKDCFPGKSLLIFLGITVLVFVLMVSRQDFGSQTAAYMLLLLGFSISFLFFLVLICRSFWFSDTS